MKCVLKIFFSISGFQGRHGRRPGEEESDVDIEGFEEEDDGKPKTPAPVINKLLIPNWQYCAHIQTCMTLPPITSTACVHFLFI